MSTKVLLTLDNPSKVAKKYLDELYYGVLLLDRRVTEKYTIEPDTKEIEEKEKKKTISPYDRVPHTHYSYEQSCIVYNTKEDLENNQGIYQDFLPDLFDDFMYEYTAKLI